MVLKFLDVVKHLRRLMGQLSGNVKQFPGKKLKFRPVDMPKVIFQVSCSELQFQWEWV